MLAIHSARLYIIRDNDGEKEIVDDSRSEKKAKNLIQVYEARKIIARPRDVTIYTVYTRSTCEYYLKFFDRRLFGSIFFSAHTRSREKIRINFFSSKTNF